MTLIFIACLGRDWEIKLKLAMKKILLVCLLVVTLLLLIVSFRKNNIITKEEALKNLTSPNSKFINWHGSEIHYLEFGDRSKETILMLHGLMGNVHNFDTLISLMKNDYHILAFDLPGFALSDQPNFEALKTTKHIEAYTAFYSFVFDTLNLHDVHLVGGSLGGWISWEICHTMPDKIKSLTLIASAGYDVEKKASRSYPLLNSKLTDLVIAKGVPKFVSRLIMGNSFYNKNIRDDKDVNRQNLNLNIDGNLKYLVGLLSSGELPDTTKITSITKPTLIIWGENDNIISYSNAQKFNRDIPISKVVIYKNCGHSPHREYPVETHNEIVSFIKQ